MRLSTLVCLSLLLLSGCFLNRSRRNKPLSVPAFTTLRAGESTSRDVVEQLGAPTEVVQLGRRSAYRYDYSVECQAALFLLVVSLRDVDTKQDRAWFFFDEAEVLTHFGSTFDSANARFGLPGFTK